MITRLEAKALEFDILKIRRDVLLNMQKNNHWTSKIKPNKGKAVTCQEQSTGDIG